MRDDGQDPPDQRKSVDTTALKKRMAKNSAERDSMKAEAKKQGFFERATTNRRIEGKALTWIDDALTLQKARSGVVSAHSTPNRRPVKTRRRAH